MCPSTAMNLFSIPIFSIINILSFQDVELTVIRDEEGAIVELILQRLNNMSHCNTFVSFVSVHLGALGALSSWVGDSS